MKCGLVQGFWAVRRAQGSRLVSRDRLVFLCNSDEEIGSPGLPAPSSRRRPAGRRPCSSSSLAWGRARRRPAKASDGIRSVSPGRPAHAGLDPDGRHQRHRGDLAGLSSSSTATSDHRGHGTTVNVGVIDGGTRYNVIAAEAFAEVDVAPVTLAEAERITTCLVRPQAVQSGGQRPGGGWRDLASDGAHRRD